MSDEFKITKELLEEWVAAAKQGDAQAAFRVGEFALNHPGDRDYDHLYDVGEAWLRRAAELGGVAMRWQIAELTSDYGWKNFGARWHRRAVTAEWRATDVAVDANTLGPHGVGTDTSLLVLGDPGDAVRVALVAAATRFFCVGSDGIEYPDPETALDADYSPNFVSDPVAGPSGGWSIWMDWKDCRCPLMAATDLRILVEELRKAGVTSIRISPIPHE